MSVLLCTNMVMEPVSSVIMPMSRSGAVSELAFSQFQEPATRSSFSKKISLSRFLEFFCINGDFMVSANWTLGAFGKSCKFAYLFLSGMANIDVWSVGITRHSSPQCCQILNQIKCIKSSSYYGIPSHSQGITWWMHHIIQDIVNYKWI